MRDYFIKEGDIHIENLLITYPIDNFNFIEIANLIKADNLFKQATILTKVHDLIIIDFITPNTLDRSVMDFIEGTVLIRLVEDTIIGHIIPVIMDIKLIAVNLNPIKEGFVLMNYMNLNLTDIALNIMDIKIILRIKINPRMADICLMEEGMSLN